MQVTREERAMRAAKAREGKNRRAGHGHPTTAEINYSSDDLEFMDAIQAWKNKMNRQFPTWREVLQVVKEIGYRKP